MYFKEIESNREAAQKNTDNLRKNAAQRLQGYAEYNGRKRGRRALLADLKAVTDLD